MQLRGAIICDAVHARVGRVRDVLLDPVSLDARWLGVLLDVDQRTVLVPASAVSEFAPGQLLLPYGADVISTAEPATTGPLTEADAARLRRHYGFTG